MQPINWDAVGAIGEVVGAFGVIATLIYLAMQIRQNTQVTRAATAQQMTNNWVQVNLEMSRNTAVTLDVDPSLPPQELQLVLSFWRAMFHQWSSCHYQHSHGSLDELLFESTITEIRTYAQDETVGRNIRRAWEAINFIYNREFVAFVSQLLQDHPIQSAALFDLEKNEPE